MRMQRLLFLFLTVIIFSCKESSAPPISKEKMQTILQDLHIAESYSIIVNQDSLHQGNDRNYDSLAHFYKTIFAHHNIDREKFQNSLSWYKQHPEELDSVYARMIDGLTEIESKFNIKKP